MLLACSFGVIIGIRISRTIVKQLGGEPETAADMAKLVAQGDLSLELDVKRGDTTSLMAQLKGMQSSLSTVVSNVRLNSESVATASAQIAKGNLDLCGSHRSGRSHCRTVTFDRSSALAMSGAGMRLGSDSGRDKISRENQFATRSRHSRMPLLLPTSDDKRPWSGKQVSKLRLSLGGLRSTN